jgi:heme exporter protein A
MHLTVSALHCRRGERDVLAGLAFTISGGEALAVTGPNGVGKTTLLRALAGLLRPTQGTIALEGGGPELSAPEQCHFVSHRDAVKASLTVGENLGFWTAFYGGAVAATEARALAALGLEQLADLPAGYLSAGQRRRLSLARLAAVQRPIWLLDEPTSALDTEGQRLLAALTHTHLADGGIVIAATHGPLPFATARNLELRAAP